MVLGAEFAAASPYLGAERHRRRGLAEASLIILRARRSSRAFLRKLAATWVHVMLYRRPLLCLLSATFALLGPVTSADDLVVALPRAVVMELCRVAMCAPLAATNLQATFLRHVYASDASHFAWGAVRAPVDEALQKELWRHRDRRGAYTRLHEQWAPSGARRCGWRA